MTNSYDAVIVGSGPNGLSAAIQLAQEGLSVLVLEGKDTVGGGTRSHELTLPGFTHDMCSTIHPLGLASPFLRELPLEDYGLSWIHPEAPLAHPLDDSSAVFIERSIEKTAGGLGEDGRPYLNLMEPLVENWKGLLADILGPFPLPPRHPFLMARFGLSAIRSATGLAKARFSGERARTVFAGMSGHSMMPLESPASAAFALTLGILAHGVGWPVVRGGSQQIASALVGYLESLGGEIVTGQMVTSLKDLPPADHVLFDLTPRQLIAIAGDALHPAYRRRLSGYRYGPGVCKVDWALDSPIPWAAEGVKRAATVHLGGSMAEIAAAERAVWDGRHPAKPYVLLAQQTLFDPSRAPSGKHTAWAYCHVPHGSSQDVSAQIEDQVERFAPGFKDCILARKVHTAGEMEVYNPNYVGGDINGGVQDYRQLYTRPVARLDPYVVPTTTDSSPTNLYLCSSSTPPGGGVHGMCGYHAARSVLRRIR
jgi:phytoene dehydrogenase-like protein